MSVLSGIINNSLRTSDKAVGIAAENLAKPDGSTRVEPVIENNGISGSSVIERRVVDEFKFKSTLLTSAAANSSGSIFKYNEQLNNALGSPEDANFISQTLVDFTNAFNIDKNANAASSRAQIIAAAQTFTNKITTYTRGLQQTKQDLENDISNTVASINTTLSQLFEINKTLGSSNGNNNVQDQRDSLLSNLAQYLSIKCTSDYTGRVTIQTTGGNDLLDPISYAQISYTQDLDLFNQNPNSDIITISRDSSSSSIKVQDAITNFGGALSGLLQARNTTLPTALSNINNAVAQVSAQINERHNQGSGFPPASSFTSENTMLLTDKAAWKGKVNFTVAGADGNPVTDLRGNAVKPLTVDFDKLSSRNAVSGQFSTQDIINEINQVAAGYSKASVGLGAVATVPGGQQQYLIDQVRLVPTSDIAAGGQMSFQLELNSGSQFGTSFQVTGLVVLNAANNPIAGQPALANTTFNLSAGQHTKTGQNIVVNLNAADASNIVRLKMLVIGADGTCDERWADFAVTNGGVNPLGGAQILNQRVEAAPANNAIGGGLAATHFAAAGPTAAAPATTARLGASIVSARFVDSNGLTVTDVNTQGYLTVSAVVGDGGIIIDPSTSTARSTSATKLDQTQNFGHWFGLNNFFTADTVNPATDIAVNPAIVSNPNLIAIGKAQEQIVQQNTMVAQTLPSAVLNLGANPANNDTITIGATTFTFSNAAGAPGTVAIGATADATLQNLYTALKNDATFTNTLTFTPPAAGAITMTVTAKNAAVGNIAVASSNVANTWRYADGLGNTTTKLMGGTASAVYDLTGGQPGIGDSITINGVPFTFGAGAPAVIIGVNAAQTIANLQTAMNLAAQTNPLLNGLFTFTIDPANADKLIISASHAGSSGNNLTIAIAGGGALLGPDGIGALPGGNKLIGGVDIPVMTSVNTHGLKIGVDSNTNMTNLSTEFFTFSQGSSLVTQTLHGFFESSFVNNMIAMHNASELQNTVDFETHQKFQELFDGITKNSKENSYGLYLELQEFIQKKELTVAVFNVVREAQDFLIRTLG